MENKFLKELDEIIERYEKRKSKPKLNHHRANELNKIATGPLWDIHKRSLPVGLDQPIMLNLSHAEATKWIQKLKPKLVDEENRIVHYYDKVRQDGYKTGVFDNDLKSLLKEETPKPEITIDDVKWEG